jgi:glutaconate CoA-transferase subunit A
MKDPPVFMTASEAVRELVSDDATIFISGFGNLYPFSLAHEIIRQGRRNLTIYKHSPELIADQLIGAGCVRKLVMSWLGNPGIGSAHCFRRAVEKRIPQGLEIEEYTHAATTGMFRAGAMGIPFLPTKALLGSDLLAKGRARVKTMNCPFTGEKLVLVPAANPDVAIVHAQRADTEGNVQAWDVLADLRDGAFASKRVIVSVEEIVPNEVVRSLPNMTVLPSFLVDAVVEEPFGAHPSATQGYYDRDNEFFFEYEELTRTVDGYQRFLADWIRGVTDRREYTKKLGPQRLSKLKPRASPSVSIDYGVYGGLTA